MGNRRIGRKRLYGVEKAGQQVDLESGLGMVGNIKSATQHRQGQEIITEIALDLEGLNGADGDNKAMAASAADASITRLTVAKFGIITEIRAVCVEQPVGGGITANSVNITTSAGDATVKSWKGATVERIGELNTVGEDISYTLDTSATHQGTAGEEDFLYVANHAAGDNSAMTAGKILIYIHGFAVPADL